MTEKTAIEIYQGFDGQTQIEVRLEDETIWLSQAQMAELFDKDVRTINEHLKTIFKEDELKETSTIRKFRIVRFRAVFPTIANESGLFDLETCPVKSTVFYFP